MTWSWRRGSVFVEAKKTTKMLTRRQQQVMQHLVGKGGYGYAVKRAGFATWLLPWFHGAHDWTSAATLYALLDVALLALGRRDDGDAVCELTDEGVELAELLTSTLTKRQQQVLKSLLVGDGFHKSQYNGCWLDPWGTIYDAWVAPSTVYFLVDAELVGLGINETSKAVAALTPRGRRLAELLP